MIFDKKAELNVLINLAASDKNVADRESKLIHLIAQANGISKDEINHMLKNPQPIHSSSALTPDEKFEHLYNLIQLMKMDGQVFRSEVVFCDQIADRPQPVFLKSTIGGIQCVGAQSLFTRHFLLRLKSAIGFTLQGFPGNRCIE